MKSWKQKHGITTTCVPLCYILHPQREYAPNDERCSSGREKSSFNVMGLFLADCTIKGWGVFVLTSRNTSYLPKCSFQIGSCMKQERNVISVEPWEGEEGTWRWAIFRSADLAWYWHQSAGVRRERGLSRSASHSDQSEKAWLWCNSGPTPPGIGSVHKQLLPGLLFWHPRQSVEEAEGSYPCSVWLLSLENRDRDSNRIWLTWVHQDWGIPSTLLAHATMPYGLNCPQAFVQFGSGTHQAEQAPLHLTVVHQLSWIQGFTLSTGCHSLVITDKQGRNVVIRSPSHLLIWHRLFSSHQCSLTKKMNVGGNCPV
jgi:hypothetical protein